MEKTPVLHNAVAGLVTDFRKPYPQTQKQSQISNELIDSMFDIVIFPYFSLCVIKRVVSPLFIYTHCIPQDENPLMDYRNAYPG